MSAIVLIVPLSPQLDDDHHYIHHSNLGVFGHATKLHLSEKRLSSHYMSITSVQQELLKSLG